MEEYKKRANWFLVQYVLLAIVAGFVIWALATGRVKEIFVMPLYVVSALFVLATTFSLLIAFEISIIGKIKELIAGIKVINGFTLEDMNLLIAYTRVDVDIEAKGLFSPGKEAVREGFITLPENIQRNVNLIWGWMRTPKDQRRFKDWYEVTRLLDLASERVGYFKIIQ